MSSPQQITKLLADWSNGDQSALDKLVPLVDQELRRIASRYMRRERPDHTLQTTALVNEAYFKLIDQRQVQWQSRAHFFAIAAKSMYRILLDYAKSQRRIKRGRDLQKVSFSDEAILSPQKSAELIALDEALKELEKFDERKYQVVCLRYFGGLTSEEIAEVLHIGKSTVEADWKLARAWLRQEMGDGF